MEQIKNYIIIALGVIMIIFMSLFAWKNSQCNVYKHNLHALNDTLTTVQMSNNELLSYKQSLILDIAELEKYTSIQEKEVKRLQKELGEKIKYISQIEGSIKHDTIFTREDSVIMVDTTSTRYYFSDKTDFYTIAGYTNVNNLLRTSQTVITQNTMPLNLNVGLTDDWTIFVKSENPNVVINNITGAQLNPKEYNKEKNGNFAIGFQMGLGGTVNYGLQFSNDGVVRHGWNFGAGWYFGIGASWNFIVF